MAEAKKLEQACIVYGSTSGHNVKYPPEKIECHY